MHRSIITWLLVLGLGSVVVLPQARATLGEPVSSVNSDKKALAATKRATTFRAFYTVYEIESPSTTLREYVSLSGIVFAVAWNGLTQPDLTQLLGSYDKQFLKARRETPPQRGVRRLRVKGPDVIVETWGHMRNLRGRAYVPALIPSGVSLDEIK